MVDRGGDVVIVVAGPGEADEVPAVTGEVLKHSDGLPLGEGVRQIERSVEAELLRYVGKELVLGLDSDGLEHLRAIGVRMRYETHGNFIIELGMVVYPGRQASAINFLYASGLSRSSSAP